LPVSFNTNKIRCLRIYIRINLDVYVLLFHNWTVKTYFSSNLQMCSATPLNVWRRNYFFLNFSTYCI
jgi:hypothetical protein